VLTKLQLINADAGYSLGAVRPKSTFNLADLPTRHLSFKVQGTNISRVLFDLDGTAQDETSAPYSATGNNPDGSYKPWTPSVGQHTLTFTLFNGNGTQGATITNIFWIIDQTRPFNANINFQPVNTPYYKGYKPDWGRLYGLRGNGLTYGWNRSTQNLMFDNNNPKSPDQRFDTGVKPGGRTWQIA